MSSLAIILLGIILFILFFYGIDEDEAKKRHPS
jgi:hypothetical protein